MRGNPKKAIFLGLMACVALYFWVPLVVGWVNKNEPTQTGKCDKVVEAASVQPTTAVKAVQDRPPWQQITEWMQNDPRTMVAPPLTTTRNPFQTPKAAAVETKAEELAEVKRPPVTPTTAGLTLTSTIVGPRRRVAQINGKIYSVGQTVEATQEDETTPVSFTLREIHPRRVVLQYDGEQFELTIPEPKMSSNIEFSKAVGGS